MSLALSHGYWVNTRKPGGQVFFVGGDTAAYRGKGPSDSYDGVTPERPLSTLSGALNKCVSGRGDTIVVLPGTITVTSAVNVTADDVTIRGYREVGPHEIPGSVIATSSDINILTINANNVTIEGLLLDHNIGASNGTANIACIKVNTTNDSTDCVGVIIRNCWLDLAGADTDTDGITLGISADANDGAVDALVEGCTIFDCDQDAIVIHLGSDRATVRNCRIFDDGTALTRYGVEVKAIDCAVENCQISVSDTATPGACIHNGVAAARLRVNDCKLSALGANTIGILAIATATQRTMGNWITATAAGKLIDYTTDNTTPSADAFISNIFAANAGLSLLDQSTVGGADA